VGPDLASVDAIAAARARRVIGFVGGGVGLAVIGVGAFFGVRAITKYNDGKKTCPNDACANESDLNSARALVDDAKTSARIANVTIGLGFAVLVGGVLLVLTSAPPATRATALKVGPGSIGGTW
jgi:hypothetical protein